MTTEEMVNLLKEQASVLDRYGVIGPWHKILAKLHAAEQLAKTCEKYKTWDHISLSIALENYRKAGEK